MSEAQNELQNESQPEPQAEPQPDARKLFDSKKHFNIPIVSGEEKRCVLRFPTDEEWIQRAARQKSIRHFLGRGNSRSDVPNAEKIDAELFERIRQDKDGAPFDAAEASAAIARLERARVTSATREGGLYRIELKVPGATTVHVLKPPTKAQQLEYGRASVRITDGRREQTTSVNLQPSAKLYDDLVQGPPENYAGAVPIVHKDIVLVEILALIQALEDEDDDPEA